MEQRIQELIKRFELIPHPEGGFFREVYRSNGKHTDIDRNYLTSIYFLITADSVSRFHRIQSDECWYFHEGSTLRIHEISPEGKHTYTDLGLNLHQGEQPFHVVRARAIFGSLLKEQNGYALVSCAVAPGFSFEDFELFTREELLKSYPQHQAIIDILT